MLRFAGCPKCGGTLALDRDVHGWYEQCLHCGYLRDKEMAVEQRSATCKTRGNKVRAR